MTFTKLKDELEKEIEDLEDIDYSTRDLLGVTSKLNKQEKKMMGKAFNLCELKAKLQAIKQCEEMVKKTIEFFDDKTLYAGESVKAIIKQKLGIK